MPGPWDAAVNKENCITLPSRRCQAHFLSTWPMIVHVSGMTTVHPSIFVSAFSCLSFLQCLVHCPLSSLKLILRTSDQESSLLLLNPPCCAFLPAWYTLEVFFSLSSQYRLSRGRVSGLCVFSFSTASSKMPSVHINVQYVFAESIQKLMKIYLSVSQVCFGYVLLLFVNMKYSWLTVFC